MYGTNFLVAPDPVGGIAAGRYLFTPQAGSVTLGPVGSATDFCEISFTVDVLKVPTIDVRPNTPGVQTFTPAYAEGTLIVPGNPNALDINGNGRDETRVDPLPVIQIVKTVTPLQRPEPGGNFTFTLVISNPGPTALTLTTLVDSIYGDLFDAGNPNVTNNTCVPLDNDVLPSTNPDSSVTCTFVGNFTGVAGDTETDIAEIDAIDENGHPVDDTDDAVVTLTPRRHPDRQDGRAVAAPGAGRELHVHARDLQPGPDGPHVDDAGGHGLRGSVQCRESERDEQHVCPAGQRRAAVDEPRLVGDVHVRGQLHGCRGDTETDIAEIDAIDENGNPVDDTDDAFVTLTPRPSSRSSRRSRRCSARSRAGTSRSRS